MSANLSNQTTIELLSLPKYAIVFLECHFAKNTRKECVA